MKVRTYSLALLSCISLLLSGSADEARMRAQEQRDKQKREAVLRESHLLRKQFKILCNAMTVDQAYETLYRNQSMQEVKTIGENLAHTWLDFTTFKDAHKWRKRCYFGLYSDGKAKTTDFLDQHESLDKFRIPDHLTPDLWQAVVDDDTFQETQTLCQNLLTALQPYKKRWGARELARIHSAYAYTIGKAWNSNFLTDSLLRKDADLVNEQGRLHMSTGTEHDWRDALKKYHVPTILRNQRQYENLIDRS